MDAQLKCTPGVCLLLAPGLVNAPKVCLSFCGNAESFDGIYMKK